MRICDPHIDISARVVALLHRKKLTLPALLVFEQLYPVRNIIASALHTLSPACALFFSDNNPAAVAAGIFEDEKRCKEFLALLREKSDAE